MVTKRGREISRLLAMRDREGLTYAELAARTGLAPTTLSWWAWRLRSEEPATCSFVEIEITEPESQTHADSGVSVRISDGVELRIDRAFDADTLRRVVTTLSSSC
jgi:hypothetical protein